MVQFGLAVTAIGAACLLWVRKRERKQRRFVQESEPVEGRITDVHVDSVHSVGGEGQRTGARYGVQVAFEYEYDGVWYRNDDIYPTGLDDYDSDEASARRKARSYDEGDTVEINVPPFAPRQGFLTETTNTSGLRFYRLVGGVVLGIGLLVTLVQAVLWVL